ncbi:MFS transporter [Saccharothrix coeruleofusca]|nr:MFS transporter [Saccharothrix coeruleofusca]
MAFAERECAPMSEALSPARDDVVTPGARRRFVASTVIDAVGSGLWMPFALLFLVHGRGLGLVESGAALTVGGFIGLASVPLVGTAADRIGFVRVLVAGNVIRCACFLCYPFVSSAWQVIVLAAVISIGDRLFWTANAPLVTALTSGRDAEKLMGTQTIARFTGAGIGAAAAAVLPAIAGAAMYNLLALANAASFALAAVLLFGVPVPGAPSAPPDPTAKPVKGSWLLLLRNRPYVAFCATHVLYALASVSKFAVLPLVVFDVLRGPQWLPGAAVAVSTVIIVTSQRPITAWFARRNRSTGMVTASILFAVSFATLATLTALPMSLATVAILAFSVLASGAEAIFAPITTATAAAAAPPHMGGRASGLFQLSWGVAQVAAPVLLTGLLSQGNVVLWSTLGILAALTIPAVLRLRASLPPGTLS